MTKQEKKRFAAVCYALGWTRSALRDVLDENPDREKIERIFEASATSKIAEAIGMKETDFDPDWNEHLSGEELFKISGRGEDPTRCN